MHIPILHLRYLSLMLLFTSNIEARAQQFSQQQIKIIQDAAVSICNKINDLRGSKSKAQIEGDVKAQLKGLAGKLADAGVSGKLSSNIEDFEGLSQEATATAVENERSCRERIFNKMFDRLSTSIENPQKTEQLGQPRKPNHVTPNQIPRVISVLGYWVGPVTCQNGQDFKVGLELGQEIGSSTMGIFSWSGSNIGISGTTLMINPNAQDGLNYILIADRKDVYKYRMRMLNPRLIEGLSTESERCSIRLERYS